MDKGCHLIFLAKAISKYYNIFLLKEKMTVVGIEAIVTLVVYGSI